MASKPHKKTWNEEMADLFRTSEAAAAALPEPYLFKFWDLDKKYFVLLEDKLVADVKTSNSPEQLMAVLPNKALDSAQYPMFMGPEKKKSCLYCVKSGTGQYQIELKEKDIMELEKDPQNAKAFTFYSKQEGNGDKCTFESAEFPDWFISTSSEAGKPIGLSQKGGTQNILFHFEKKS
ncbi:interleukin-36 alpha-like [Thamnophis elegans]|uniref:interleukin-36 alpha-like n=1 Tax=Thamnophis elegans TaxID=35005 RepID=UPI001376A75A|nr:interleukin-36 alpha-like [Thamnophis elegans]XP_032084758.1 interleukin-36 alpha-like [Thamnophis elegans]XP_032084759.1 interleukin-36 alpha-like [Thamnophis elegans]